MITPGLSGSVIAVIFGVYEKMIYSLTNLFKDFKSNFKFLFFLSLGILLGAVWFSNIIIFLYNRHEVLTKFCFIGLILGGIPFLFSELKEKNEKINYKAFFITIIISFSLLLISKNIINLNISQNMNIPNLFCAGFIYSIGKVIPGISSSFLLILIGMYEFVLSFFAHPITFGFNNINNLIPFFIGFLIGVILLLKLIKYLLENKFSLTYSVIIAFVISSIFVLVPTFNNLKEYLLGILFMMICFIFSYKFTK